MHSHRSGLDPRCGYDKVFAHVLELRHRNSLYATEIEQITELVQEQLWGWHFVPHHTGRVVKPASYPSKRQPTVPNHFLCVSFADQTDLVQVRFSVFGC